MSIQSQPEVQELMGGLAFPESPRWHDGRLWLSDWGAGEVIALRLDGSSEVVARVQSFPMCIDHLPNGQLLIVDSTARRIVRREANGTPVIHADLSGFGEHPWNDIAVDGRGNAYVNNIGFDFPDGEVAPGFIVLVTAAGSVRQVANELEFPNGMIVTPDNRTLIVAESYGNRLTAFDIIADGGLANRRTWAELEDHPDGICLDAEGAIWYGDVGTRRAVRVREGGEILQVLELDRGCFACALGGPDGRTLLLIANHFGDASGDQAAEPMGQVLTAVAPAPAATRPNGRSWASG
jgi:sugar lactone lactonase YvrE